MKSFLRTEPLSNVTAPRALDLAEAFAFSGYVALYIWRLQESTWSSWFVFPIWLTASIFVHRDNPKSLGWRADNLWSATKRSAVVFLPFIAGLFVVGFLLDGWQRPPSHPLAEIRFLRYLAFCLLQQVALNSFLTNRLLAATESQVRTSLLAGAIFAALHWPNPVLVPLTWIGGTAMSWLFVRERNILPLTLGQGILGTLVWWAFPLAWHHSMRVGPGYYHFHLQ